MTRNDGVRGVLDLEKDATVRVVPGRDGVTVRAVCGTVLVTQSGDLEDHVLERGMERRFRGRGKVVAWALRPSRLAVVHAGAGQNAAPAPLTPAGVAS
jgi:hypothetical protein